MFQKLERIRALITHINELTLSGEHTDTFEPKATFPGLTLSPLRRRFLFWGVDAVMQSLVQQANHFTTLGIHCQAIVADIAAVVTVSNLAKTLQRKMGCVVQFRRIMDHQNRASHLIDLFEHPLAMRRQHCLVRYIGT
jgi:hypothetical protein